MGKVVGIDRAAREVVLEDRRIGFDYLVLATGARHSYFGNDEWEEAAPGLKKIADATQIRERVLLAFERAEVTADPVERQRLLTFVVVGGGPDRGRDGRGRGRTRQPRAGRRLPRHRPHGRAGDPGRGRRAGAGRSSRPSLSAKARDAARAAAASRSGWAAACTVCDADGVTVGDERIAARTVIWAAGVIASPAAKWLEAEARSRRPGHGRRPTCSVPGLSATCSRSATRSRSMVPDAARARHRTGRQADGQPMSAA